MKSSCMCFIATRNELNRPQEKNSWDVQVHLANCHRILCKEYPIKMTLFASSHPFVTVIAVVQFLGICRSFNLLRVISVLTND